MVQVANTHHSVREIYRITHVAARTPMVGAGARCDRQAAERIMLAVTEVNGCELGSYAHTRLALVAGASDAEVRALIDGCADRPRRPVRQQAGPPPAGNYSDDDVGRALGNR